MTAFTRRFMRHAVASLLVILGAVACSPTGQGAANTATASTDPVTLPRPKAPASKGPLRILFVGNSHTDYYVSLPQMFRDLCAANNVDIQVDELVEMGISLDEIYETAKAKADADFARTDPDGNYYDYVVLQEKTTVAIDDADLYRESVGRYADRIHRNSPGAAIYVYELMSPANFATEHNDFVEWQGEADRNAKAAARSIANAGIFRLRDAVRDAYQGAHGYRHEVDGADRLRHGERNLHMLNDAGFLASALLYTTLFDRMPGVPDAMSFATGVGDNDGQQTMPVKAAVSDPTALLKIAESNK